MYCIDMHHVTISFPTSTTLYESVNECIFFITVSYIQLWSASMILQNTKIPYKPESRIDFQSTLCPKSKKEENTFKYLFPQSDLDFLEHILKRITHISCVILLANHIKHVKM